MKLDGRLIRDTGYNFAGIAFPVIISLVTVPPYLHAMGAARYGVLSLIWLLFGYFGLFDFGLSRSTANRLAQIGPADPGLRDSVFRTSIVLNCGLGAIAAIAFPFLAGPILGLLSQSISGFSEEVIDALPLTALLFPLAMVTNVYVGRFQAEERFSTLNTIQMIGAIGIQGLPLVLVLTNSPRLDVAILGVVLSRAAMLIALDLFTSHSWILRAGPIVNRPEAKKLLGYGGWIAMTNAINPILVSADQFVIAFLLGAASVAHYAIPFNLAQKLLIVPRALSQTIFPRLSSLNKADAHGLAERSAVHLCDILAMICAPAVVLSHFALVLWIGEDFANAAGGVTAALLVGAFVNGVSYVPMSLSHGQRRVSGPALLQLAEFVPFIIILYLSVRTYGITGAGYAWVARATIDAVLLFRISRLSFSNLTGLLPGMGIVAVGWLVSIFLAPPPLTAIGLAAILGSAAAAKMAYGFFRRREPKPDALPG